MARTEPRTYGFFSMLWRLALAGVFLFGMAGAAGYFAVVHLVRTPETQAPDLLTLSIEDALRTASEEGFAVRIAKTEATTMLGPGRVLSQRPAPGDPVKNGSIVNLTISAEPGGAGAAVALGVARE